MATLRPAMRMLVARRMPSIVDWPVPYRLSNRCLVCASFTATTGNARALSAAIARSRMTPVVVSSVPARTSGSWSRRSLCSSETRSQPSSIVSVGWMSATDRRWA